jgi:hypothetical protein
VDLHLHEIMSSLVPEVTDDNKVCTYLVIYLFIYLVPEVFVRVKHESRVHLTMNNCRLDKTRPKIIMVEQP